jgi:hypothetical protein
MGCEAGSIINKITQRTPWRKNPKVHHRIHNSSPPVPILSQSNPIHTLQPVSLRSILIPSSHLRLGPPSGLFPFGAITPKSCTLFCPLPRWYKQKQQSFENFYKITDNTEKKVIRLTMKPHTLTTATATTLLLLLLLL